MTSSKYRLRGVYGAPLVRDTGIELDDKVDMSDLLEEVGKDAIKAIQKEIGRASFKGQPTRLKNSFSYRIEGKSTLVIESNHEAAQYLNRGVRAHQMKYLVNSKGPIPIVLDNGSVIFRNATPKSMRDGKWYHPGIRGKHFLDRGVEKARAEMKDTVKKDIQSRFKKRFSGKKA